MTEQTPWSREEFEAQLRGMERYYHIHHPMHTLMNAGELTQKQLQGWVANRFYYQIMIPIKDANILANCPDRETRAIWTQRILDHDGQPGDPGGIEAWVQLGIAVGMTREEVTSLEHVLPGVKFAVDAYVNFARNSNWHEAASSSLTELFAPKIHQQRLDNWPELYPWVEQEGYIYFRKRLSEARRDVEHGLEITLDFYKTRAQQERMLEILKFKLNVLWTMADAMYMAYINDMPPYFNIKEN
ncbi:MAG: pyrroloquinoline-quinone synthase PqqC [Gammaproteobacteria bacterium]|jgi:pyrroloquinoline-quinone synthase|nr:pyrroloquinoline-quinone synthase PqqC [Gammaproteobacteria bacterium]MBT4146251.1 pyrroloquinoline-quinone synthase PqqC [Gammaproteobacteria bacterium]MBT5223444.1 pyrroloquinoline-quinone synthase PqqC [Gammaproteobacteria bacterium]MBT5826873.1 pyrroloquinoline-quinone synthase PqqC [Gammaproteobacteria bacterium]MBT5967482.1 pyrroloquinoline-quinone synthase PqqC [Gammaproteobacteria bacterium]